jgi:hypothetical protein
MFPGRFLWLAYLLDSVTIHLQFLLNNVKILLLKEGLLQGEIQWQHSTKIHIEGTVCALMCFVFFGFEVLSCLFVWRVALVLPCFAFTLFSSSHPSWVTSIHTLIHSWEDEYHYRLFQISVLHTSTPPHPTTKPLSMRIVIKRKQFLYISKITFIDTHHLRI